VGSEARHTHPQVSSSFLLLHEQEAEEAGWGRVVPEVWLLRQQSSRVVKEIVLPGRLRCQGDWGGQRDLAVLTST
jgi:hypothetical protein